MNWASEDLSNALAVFHVEGGGLNRISPDRFALAQSNLAIVHSALSLRPPPLKATESYLATEVSPLRRRQLETGRYLARKAIELLGGDPATDIPADERGIPIWPREYTGSISHTDTDCAVVVGSRMNITSVGIDLETNEENFSEDEWDLVSSEAERFDSAIWSELSVGQYVNLLFSAKEAIYKCLSPVNTIDFDFEDVECRPRADGRGFHAQATKTGIPVNVLSDLSVDWTPFGRHILTLACLPAQDV